MNLVSSWCFCLIRLDNIRVKMLNSSCEGNVFDKITKVEEYNQEVEPKVSVSKGYHCLGSLLVNSFDIKIEGEPTANHLISFFTQWRYPLSQCIKVKQCPLFLCDAMCLQASDILLDDQIVSKSIPYTLVVTLKRNKIHQKPNIQI